MKLFLLIATLLLQAPAPAGSVTGRVTVAGSGQPVSEAEIAVFANGVLLETITDENGRFSLANVPLGRQTVIIRAEGFFAAPAANALPQRQAEIPVTVAQQAVTVSVEMVRGAIITGKVVDPQGRPLILASVRAMRDGSTDIIVSRETDDQGEYRMFWVPPGEYIIGVLPRPAPPANLATVMEGPVFTRFAPTLFPGTPDFARATKVSVKPGDEIRGIDISARLDVVNTSPRPAPASALALAAPEIPGVKVSGQITNALMPATGLAALLVATEAEPGPPRQVGQVMLDAVTVPFEFPSVPPGKYDFYVRMVDPRGSLGTGGATQAWGRTTIEVRDRDVDGVRVTIHPSFDVPGTIMIDGRPAPAGGDLKVGLVPMGTAGRIANYRGITTRDQIPGDGGKFSIPRAADGDYEVVVKSLPATAYVADIRQGDVSILVSGVSVRDVPPAPFVVLLGTDGGSVEGVCIDGEKKPVSGATVLLVPQDRQFWPLGKRVTSGPDGKYVIRGVRPGAYKLFALTGTIPQAALTPETASKYDSRSVGIAVKASETAKADTVVITD